MTPEQRRLLEMAGILRRNTPDYLLTEGEEGGDDTGGGDDPFADDGGGDDPFADDGADDAFGEEEAADTEDGGSEEGSNREPPEELDAEDIKKFGSPRFLDLEKRLTNMFNQSFTSASVAAQELETYPGNAIPEEETTPAKDETPDEEPKEETEEKEDDEKNESFYRYGNRRDKWLISEAIRLLTEAEAEGAAADEFDMEMFCTELANYMDTVHNTEDIEAGIFNAARQMVLNNFGTDTEKEFVDMLASVSQDKWSFITTGFEGGPETPIAVGGNSEAAGA